MFDLEAGDDLDLVVETARRFAESELAPHAREAERDRRVSAALRSAWQEIGLASLEVPESLGGAGLGCLARTLVNEELAAGDVGATIALDGLGAALAVLLETGGEPAVAALAKVTRHGERRALLVTPSDAACEVEGDTISIDAPWVPAEEAAVVVALVGEEALLVTDGLELEPSRGAGLRAAGSARLQVHSGAIAGRWANASGAGRALARARLHHASLLLGVLRATCEFSAAYSQEREAFGRPIGHHQALAFLITDMRMSLDAARLVVHEAAWRVDRGLPCEIEAASAWAEVIEASRTIGPDGVQILGGHGFMADYPVEKHMREARALGLVLGGFDAAIDLAGRALVTQPSPLALAAEGAL